MVAHGNYQLCHFAIFIHSSSFTFCAAYLLYSTSSAVNRVELDGSQRTTVTSSGTRGVRALDFDFR